MVKKIALVALLMALFAAFKTFGMGDYLSLSYIKASQLRFAELYTNHPVSVIATYMAIYIVTTALSLPGATILTLVGGAIFGLITGTLIISFASTIGATLACLAARFLLRDWVEKRFFNKLKTFHEGFAREGGFYLFSLRLVPIFPFFVINLVMGITRIKLFQFYWISQLGMLPATIVYVNAGKELARIESLSGILSPGLLIAFGLLGLLPLAAKKLVDGLQQKQKSNKLTAGNPTKPSGTDKTDK